MKENKRQQNIKFAEREIMQMHLIGTTMNRLLAAHTHTHTLLWIKWNEIEAKNGKRRGERRTETKREKNQLFDFCTLCVRSGRSVRRSFCTIFYAHTILNEIERTATQWNEEEEKKNGTRREMLHISCTYIVYTRTLSVLRRLRFTFWRKNIAKCVLN